MVVVGSLQLLAFGFRTTAPLPREVLATLDHVQHRGTLRVLDAIYIARNESGSFVVDNNCRDLISVPSGVSPLLQLLGDNSCELDIAPTLELCSSSEVGFDLLDAENFGAHVAPGTSVLVLLVEATWVADLLHIAVESGGYPVAYGCMEPETALVFGAHLAAAAEAIATVERANADRARVTLDALG